MSEDDVVIVTSADSRKGKYDLWDFINALLEQKGFEVRFERQQPDQTDK